MPWYVVYKGKVPGVYDDWEECRRQVHRFSGNSYKGYTTRAEAESVTPLASGNALVPVFGDASCLNLLETLNGDA